MKAALRGGGALAPREMESLEAATNAYRFRVNRSTEINPIIAL
jgi:hypothetical protein